MIHFTLIESSKRRWMVAIGLSVFALVFAGCGGDDSGASDGGGTPEAATNTGTRETGTATDAQSDAPANPGDTRTDVENSDVGDGGPNDVRISLDASDARSDAYADADTDASSDAGVSDASDASLDTIDAPDASPEGGPTTDATADGDGSGPTVDKDCHDCMTMKLGADGGADGCDALTGNAAAGPATGMSLRQLCRETLDCFHRTNCHANAVYECYCGTATDQGTCLSATDIPMPGACKTELDRSLEIPPGSMGSAALDRIVNPVYAGGVAGIAGTFEDSPAPDGCLEVCIPYTPTLR